ncbi:MAG: hypothetical protein AVDCRST_MAG69-131, partial [uncultured Solirubrobacteraceae bacterium]
GADEPPRGGPGPRPRVAGRVARRPDDSVRGAPDRTAPHDGQTAEPAELDSM